MTPTVKSPLPPGEGAKLQAADFLQVRQAPMVGSMLSAIILTLVVLPAVLLLWETRLLARETGKLIK